MSRLRPTFAGRPVARLAASEFNKKKIGRDARRRQRIKIPPMCRPGIESEHTSETHQPRVVGELKTIDVYFEGLVTRSMAAN